MIGRELLGRPATGDETGFGQKPNLFHRDRKLVGDHRAEAVSEERKRAIKVRSELVPQSVDQGGYGLKRLLRQAPFASGNRTGQIDPNPFREGAQLTPVERSSALYEREADGGGRWRRTGTEEASGCYRLEGPYGLPEARAVASGTEFHPA